MQIFHLDNIQGRKKVINRRCRLKGLIFENYPKFKSLCHSFHIECPEENSWAFSIYKKEKNIRKEQNTPSSITPEKSYVKMGSRRFTSPTATKLLRSAAAEDDDNGKIIKALSLFNTL